MPRDDELDDASPSALVARALAALLSAPPYAPELAFERSVGGLAFRADAPAGAALLRAAAALAVRGSDEAAYALLAHLAAVEANREAVAGALEEAAAAERGALTLARDAAPGARAAALTLMLRLAPAHSPLSARDLLELSPRGALDGAVECLVALLGAPPPPAHLANDAPELALACARLVWGLTLPETLYASVGGDEAAGEDTNATPLAELSRRYGENVNELISLVLDRPLLQRAAAVVRPWLVKHASKLNGGGAAVAAAAAAAASEAGGSGGSGGGGGGGGGFAEDASDLDGGLHAMCGFLLRALHNLLLFSTQAQGKLREHVSAPGSVVEALVLPYTLMCTAAVSAVEEYRGRLAAEEGAAGASSAAELLPLHQQLLASLHSALALLAVATYKIRVLRPALRDGRLVQGALAVRSVREHVPCLASLLSLTANADVLLKVTGSAPAPSSSDGGGKRKTFGAPLPAAATAVSVNHGLRSLLVSAVEELAPEERERLLRRLRTADPASAPTATSGTSYDLLKEVAWPGGVVGGGNGGSGGNGGGGRGKSGEEAAGAAAAASAAADAPTPVCALSGRILTDVVILNVAADSPLVRAPAATAPGVYMRLRKGAEGKGETGDRYALHCERAAAEDWTELPPPLEGMEDQQAVAADEVMEEPERDDPVLLAVQRGQLARLRASGGGGR